MDTLRIALERFVAFLPDLAAGLVVLALGAVLATVLRRLTNAVLPRAGFDDFLSSRRLTARPPESRPGTRAVGTGVYWVVLLGATMQAAEAWRLSAVADGIARVFGYLPNVVSAVVVFGAAWIAGNVVAARLREASVASPWTTGIVPGAVRAGILTIGAFMALRQLLIATEILVIAFSLAFGAIAVAAALAAGLGGRRAVERMSEDWYDRQQQKRRREAVVHEGGESEAEVSRVH